MPAHRFVVLTLAFRQEGKTWVGTCQELGTSTCGRSLNRAHDELKELVTLHLDSPPEAGRGARALLPGARHPLLRRRWTREGGARRPGRQRDLCARPPRADPCVAGLPPCGGRTPGHHGQAAHQAVSTGRVAGSTPKELFRCIAPFVRLSSPRLRPCRCSGGQNQGACRRSPKTIHGRP